MKPFLIFGALLAFAGAAWADLVVEQTIESPGINGTMTFKVKGQKARVDMPVPTGGTATTYIDSGTGDMMVMVHAQKMGMKMNLTKIAKKAEADQKAAGFDPASVKPVATGNKQKIGEWNAEEYTISSPALNVTLWISADLPNWKAIKDQLSLFTKTITAGTFDPNAYDLPGMVVKTEAKSSAFTITSTMVKATEMNVDPSEFTVPEGYTMMPVPAGLAE